MYDREYILNISEDLVTLVQDHIQGLLDSMEEGEAAGLDLEAFIQDSVNDLVEVKDVCKVGVAIEGNGKLSVSIDLVTEEGEDHVS